MNAHPPSGLGPKRAVPVLLQNGFRPFFLLAGLYGSLLIPLWLGAYIKGWFELPWTAGLFHGHELVFGFVTAAISGFLLTAVPNWERSRPATSWRLLTLVSIWIIGRAAMWSAGILPPLVVAVLDIAYLPLLVVIGIPELIKNKSNRNKIFIVLILLLGFGNILTHMSAGGFDVWANPLLISIDIVVIIIAVLGGRVIPAFTAGALGQSLGHTKKVRPHSTIDMIAIISVVAVFLSDVVGGYLTNNYPVASIVVVVAGIINLVRMRGWLTSHTLRQPIVWVLHLGYAWLAIGMILRGVFEYADMGPLALHGVAVGAIGTMTLGIMSRAALGHSGRALVTPRLVVISYVLVSVAAIARLCQPLLGNDALIIAAGAWSIAFALFTMTYLPIIALPRINPPN